MSVRWHSMGGMLSECCSRKSVRGHVSRLFHILWTLWCALDKMERKAVCAQIKATACVMIAKGTLTLEFPDFWELLSWRMVCFQPPRIFQPQSEPPEEECQTAFQIFCLLHRAGLHYLHTQYVLQAMARWTALSSWFLSCESLDWPDVTKGRPVLFAWKVIVSCFQISIISQHLEIRLFPHKSPDLQIFLKMWNSCYVGPAFPHGSCCRNG